MTITYFGQAPNNNKFSSSTRKNVAAFESGGFFRQQRVSAKGVQEDELRKPKQLDIEVEETHATIVSPPRPSTSRQLQSSQETQELDLDNAFEEVDLEEESEIGDLSDSDFDDRQLSPTMSATLDDYSELSTSDDCSPKSDRYNYDRNLSAPSPNKKDSDRDLYIFTNEPRRPLPERFQDLSGSPEQKLISTEFLIQSANPRQSYLKELVNAEINGESRESAKFQVGRVSPRDVFLRRTINAEMKQRGAKQRVHNAINERGHAMWLKKQANEEIKTKSRKEQVLSALKERFQVRQNKANVMDSLKVKFRSKRLMKKAGNEIEYRRSCIHFIQRNPWLLDKSAYSQIQVQINRNPKAAYLKMLICEEIRNIAEQKEEVADMGVPTWGTSTNCLTRDQQNDVAMQFLKMEINFEIIKYGRMRARRHQIHRIMRQQAMKRKVLKQLKSEALERRARQLRKQINEVIETKGMESRLAEAIRCDLTQGLTEGLQDESIARGIQAAISNGIQRGVADGLRRMRAKTMKTPDYYSVCAPAWYAHLAHSEREEIQTMVWGSNQHYGGMTDEARTDLMNKFHLSEAQLDEIVKYFGGSPVSSRSAATSSRNSATFFNQHKLRMQIRDRMVADDRAIESPGSKEFFLRTLINNLVAKPNMNRGQKKMWLLARHIAMPEQAYLKMKVNEIIKNIGFVKERQRLRAIMRQVNTVIEARGHKAAVNQQITCLRKTIEWRQNLSYLLNKEVKQRSLKKRLVAEIKVAGAKNRCMREIRRIGLEREVNRLRVQRGEIIVSMTTLGSVTKKKFIDRTKPVSRAVFLKDQVNSIIRQRGLRAQVNEIFRARGRTMALKEGVNQIIRQRNLKRQLCLEIKIRQKQVTLKSMVCSEIRRIAAYATAKLLEQKQEVARQLNEARLQRGQTILDMSSFESLDRPLKRRAVRPPPVPSAISEAIRMRMHLLKTKERINKDILQMGRARELKRQVNMIFKTHGLKAGLVMEIKQRGAAVRAKANVNEEIKQRMRLIRAKERVNREIHWRRNVLRMKRSSDQGFEDFRGNWRTTEEKVKKEQNSIEMKPLSKAQRYRGLPVARQMYLKMECNRYFRQRGLKTELQRELLQRFKTVDNKVAVCQEILERARVKAWRAQVREVMRQRSQKSAINCAILEGNWRLRTAADRLAIIARKNMQRAVDQIIAQRSRKIRVNREIVDAAAAKEEDARIARLHELVNQEMKIRLTKMKINKRIKSLALQAKLNWLRRKRGEVLSKMGQAEMRQECLKRKIVVTESSEPTPYQKWAAQLKKKKPKSSAFSVYQLVFRQRSLKAKVMEEIVRIGQYKRYKRAMLMELRMIKLKQLVGREIIKFGLQRDRKKLLVEAIKIRGHKARVCHAIRLRQHWLLDSRLRFVQQKQRYLKKQLNRSIEAFGERLRKYELIRERAEHRRRRQHVDRIILQSRLKERCLKAIEQIGTQRSLKKQLVTEIKQRCLKNRLNCELRMVVEALRKQDVHRVSQLEERQVILKSRVNSAIKARQMKAAVERMLRLRSRVVELKAEVNHEIRQRGLKAQCMRQIQELGQTMRRRRWVCEELKQRSRFAHVVEDIRTRFYWLRPSSFTPEVSVTVLYKQELKFKEVLKDIQHLGNQMKIHKIIKERGKVMALKAQINQIIRQAGLKILACEEIRERGYQVYWKMQVVKDIRLRRTRENVLKEVEEKGQSCLHATPYHLCRGVDLTPVQKMKRAVNQYFIQKGLKAKVNKDLLDRAKQIYWKKQTMMIISQGGRKIKINQIIRDIGKQRYLKKQINILIKQGGLKSKVCHDIRQRGYIAHLKKETCRAIRIRGNKARVCHAIRQIARTKFLKKQLNTIIRQTGLKAAVNHKIRQKRFNLKKPKWNRGQEIAAFRERHQIRWQRDARPWWEMPSGKSLKNAKKPSSAPCLFSEHLNEQLDHVNMERATIPSGQRRGRRAQLPKRPIDANERHLAAVSQQQPGLRSVPRQAQQTQEETAEPTMEYAIDLPNPRPERVSNLEDSHCSVFDDMEGSYGDAVSQKGIAVMKLVEQVTVASEARDRQERDLMTLRAKVEQYKSDFERLNERLVMDKVELFEQMEELRRENELLRTKMMHQAKEKSKKQRELAISRQAKEASVTPKNGLTKRRRTSISRLLF